MKSDELQAIADTLLRIATADMNPRQLLKAVRKEHPKASKKQIVRAAFLTVIENAGRDSAKSTRLHRFALVERAPTSGDEPDVSNDDRRPSPGNPVGRLWNSAR